MRLDSRIRLSHDDQRNLQRYLDARNREHKSFPDEELKPGIVAIDKGNQAHPDIGAPYVISKVGSEKIYDEIGEKKVFTYDVKHNLFTEKFRISSTEHTSDIAEEIGGNYVVHYPYNLGSFEVPKEGKEAVKTAMFSSLSGEEIESELSKTVRNIAHTLGESYYPEIASGSGLYD